MRRLQRRFLAQHSIAMLGKCCSYLKECRNNVAMLCCAKNRCRESSPAGFGLPSRKLFWTAVLGYHDCVSELNGSTMFHKSWLLIQSNFGLSLHGSTLVQN